MNCNSSQYNEFRDQCCHTIIIYLIHLDNLKYSKTACVHLYIYM
jgi:hypothetical protein